MAQAKLQMGRREWAALALLATVWGGSFFFNKIAVAELPALTVVLGRVALAAVVLQLVVPALGLRMPTSRAAWRRFAVMGLLNNLLPFSLIVWGQTEIDSSLAAILNAATPLWTVLLAHGLTHDERLTPHRVVGVLCGMVGVALVVGVDALTGAGQHMAAQLAVIGATVSYALAGIYGKRFRDEPPIVVATGQVTASSVLLLPLVLWIDRPWRLPSPTPATWGALLGLALLCTAAAYLIYFWLLRRAGATNLLLVTLLIPVSATLLGTALLGERPTLNALGGFALIGLGLLIIDGRLRLRWAKRPVARKLPVR